MDIKNLTSITQINLYAHTNYFTEILKLYDSKKLPNKIIFCGPKGIGKATMAYHLINYIFSKNDEYKYNFNDFVINKLNNSYNLINKKLHPNFHLIDVVAGKKNIEISQIREMINYSNKSTFNNRERIILIDNVENLNLNSLNALLKIVEEPNEGIIFILIFDTNKNILDTLKSRCLKFNLSLSCEESIKISNKILNSNIFDLISNDMLYYYNTPGDLINLINFANSVNIDLKKINLKVFLLHLIDNGYYKNNLYVKSNICKFIELYLLKLMKFSSSKSKINSLYRESVKKIYEMNKFNLDQESIFIHLKGKLFNG
tara:strand:+ start:2449 stop:3396 length:948 start_codon:yes stop_codon:yes gene_type:complete